MILTQAMHTLAELHVRQFDIKTEQSVQVDGVSRLYVLFTQAVQRLAEVHAMQFGIVDEHSLQMEGVSR